MKRIFITVITAVLLSSVARADYTLFGTVYNYDRTSGTADTANSYCELNAYREGTGSEIGHQNNCPEDPVDGDKIYSAGAPLPAYYSTEVGSQWPTPPSAGQVIRVVLETHEPEEGWAGETYIGSTTTVITPADISGGGSDNIPPSDLVCLPAPAVTNITSMTFSLSWTGLDIDFIQGYILYRSDNGGATYNPVTEQPQNRNGSITYTDKDPLLAQGTVYYYKVSVLFDWPGNTPQYYETKAKSKECGGVMLLSPTATATPTVTMTLTATPTVTPTITPSVTRTITCTHSMTFTATPTCTPSVTQTDVQTATFTATPSMTGTPTLTPTPTSQFHQGLVNTLVSEKLVVFNNPVEDGILSMAFYVETAGAAFIYLYTLTGEMAMSVSLDVGAGPVRHEEDIGALSRGIYIVRVAIGSGEAVNLPLRKIAKTR